MSLAAYPDEVAQRIFDILDYEPTKLALFGPHGSLFYGDQDRLPTTPTICIEAGVTSKVLAGAPNMALVRHQCFILVYHAEVQNTEINKKESEIIAKGIAKELDKNLQLVGPDGEEGIVTHGFCASIDPGYAVKNGTLYKAVRIEWNGTCKTRLGV